MSLFGGEELAFALFLQDEITGRAIGLNYCHSLPLRFSCLNLTMLWAINVYNGEKVAQWKY